MSSGAGIKSRPPGGPEGAGKAQRTYAALAAATAAEIAATGGFTAERVADRAGTSPATFYAHFSSKDGALVAAFSRVMDELAALIDRELSLERLLDEGLADLCRSLVGEGVAFFSRYALVFRAALARVPESRAMRDVYREHERAAHDRYLRFVELGQAAGRLRPGDPAVLATAFLVLTEGLNNPRLLAGTGDPDAVQAEVTRGLEAVLAP